MATVLTSRKPTQRDRKREVPEDLPGSKKSTACVERSVKNLGGPRGSWGDPGRPLREECQRPFRESDPLVVLGGRESRPQGEAVDRGSQPAKETGAGHDGPDVDLSTSLQGIARKARREPKHRFRNLYGQLNEDFLHECWRGVRKSAACGVDGMSAAGR